MELEIFTGEKSRNAFDIASLIYNPDALGALEMLAEMLCSQSGMVPEHLRENKGDMMAVIMQAGRWGLDPLMVAQSTFCLNGIIGYEAKLMQAIVKSNGGLWFTGEHYGPWEKIVGNTRSTQVNKKGKFGDYSQQKDVPNWSEEDEKECGYLITGHFPDGRTEEMDIPLITCKPRHSTNWTYDPKQQIHYAAVKRFVRRYAPELAIGVRDYDDVRCMNEEKEVNPTKENGNKKIKRRAILLPEQANADNKVNKVNEVNEVETLENDFQFFQDDDKNDDIFERVKAITNQEQYDLMVQECIIAKDSLGEPELKQLRAMMTNKKNSLKKN